MLRLAFLLIFYFYNYLNWIVIPLRKMLKNYKYWNNELKLENLIIPLFIVYLSIRRMNLVLCTFAYFVYMCVTGVTVRERKLPAEPCKV